MRTWGSGAAASTRAEVRTPDCWNFKLLAKVGTPPEVGILFEMRAFFKLAYLSRFYIYLS